MIEDEDSKGRRNLVVASMVILLAVWLRAPVEGLAESLFKVKPVDPKFAFRVWLAAGAVLIYFGLRFRFSDENLKAIGPLNAEYLEVEQRVLRLWLAKKMKNYVRTQRAGSLNVNGFGMIVEAQRRGIVQSQGGQIEPVLAGIRVAKVVRSSTSYPANGPVSLNFIQADLMLSFKWDLGQSGTGVPIGFDVPLGARLRIQCNALGWLLLYSKGSMQVLLPWSLAGLALLASVYKTVRTW
ncbi:hypothetical protein [Variovorax sp. PAMC26660]|uniref:hypothetical protein n=1 Tax=Variovorax sp. PAMC26660 TaxID=2762322 RepID=UPI00164D6209|nr:hypothetical protein [Variovorax sp. PAMC26660]QNK66074.1 hypothetical protein H7F35_23115 [Variovorax sp. PAMC26660]